MSCENVESDKSVKQYKYIMRKKSEEKALLLIEVDCLSEKWHFIELFTNYNLRLTKKTL